MRRLLGIRAKIWGEAPYITLILHLWHFIGGDGRHSDSVVSHEFSRNGCGELEMSFATLKKQDVVVGTSHNR